MTWMDETADGWADQPPASAARPGHRRRPRSPRGSRIALAVLGLLVLLVVLVVLALPLLTVRSDGNEAKTNLTLALDALRAGDLPSATQHVSDARANVTRAEAAAGGTRLGVLAKLPVAGDAVGDLRSLVTALDNAVAVAEVGVDVYPQVLGDDADLIRDGVVDLTALVRVIGAADEVTTHLGAAHAALDTIEAGTPFVGETIGTARDAALEQVVSLESTIDAYRPLLDVMPSLLGAAAPATYLVTVMNPAEMRASGGATLSVAEMTITAGRVEFGDTGATTDFTDNNERISWPPVTGNPWHVGPLPLVNATLSGNWTTSGEELLRAWEATTGRAPQALIALDVQALSDLFRITGPTTVPGYGTLNSGNLVERLVGSYDDFKNDAERKAVNAAIIPLLREKLLDGGKFVQKAQSLVASAQERHVVTYFRDPAVQEVAAGLGLGGDLSTTTQDYLGVFTQNTNASKVDFWAQRTLASDVTLNADGSADVAVTVTLANPTPPFERGDVDPQRGYYTRWAFPQVIAYLPTGAVLGEVLVDGAAPENLNSFAERDRQVLFSTVTLEPGATRVFTYAYTVPGAAVPDGEGGRRYGLDIDPQGTVNPTAVSVVLRLPAGFREAGIVGDWTVDPDLTLTLTETEGRYVRSSVTYVPE